MVQIKNLLPLVLVALMNACSMQPLIDASLPPVVPDNRELPAEPTPKVVTPPAMPSERAVAIKAESTLPIAVQSLLTKASTLRSEADVMGAIAALERAAKIAPRSPLVYFELAKTYWQLKNGVKARVFAEKALSLAPSASLARDIKQLLIRLPN